MQNRTHFYIYDEFLADRKYHRIVSELEGRISTLGLQGPIVRLSPLRDVKETLQGFIRDRISTVVIVGDDSTVDRVMPFLPDIHSPVGYLPLRSPCAIAERFGIRTGLSACDILAARYLEAVDVGIINNQYFLYQISLEKSVASLFISEKYRLYSETGADFVISNTDGSLHDGQLTIRMRPCHTVSTAWSFRKRVTPETVLRASTVRIESETIMSVTVDLHQIEGKIFQLGIKPRGMHWIIGRQGIAKFH
ncbi:hypothetical protein IT408_04630 [Candidatus Uhrbacteria bacterium]|nr:hypothetical protein [Candidatus Uhrbacteria bacterium]